MRRRRPRPGRLAVDSCAARVRGADALLLPLVRGPTTSRRRRPGARWSSSAPARTASARASSSTTAARARRRRFRRARLRGRAPQLQPGDGVDRLRHVGPALPRAADAGARARRLRARAAARASSSRSAARRRSRWRPALAAAGVPLLGDPLPAIERAEDRGRFGALLASSGCGAGVGRGGDSAEAARSPSASATRCSSARITSSAAAACVSRAGPTSSRSTSRRSSTSSSRARSSSTSTSSATASRAWVGGDPRARRAGRCPLRRLGLRDPGAVGDAPSSRPRSARSRSDSPRGLGVRGLLNLQLALADGELYVLEANPRASRTVPFVAKATGLPLVDHACRLLLGEPLAELELPSAPTPTRAWAKEAVFPADRFASAAERGPEMRSTGEVMASGNTVSQAYGRVLRASGRGRRGGSIGVSLQTAQRDAG